MMKYSLFTLALVTAAPALAQTGDAPPSGAQVTPPPAFITAAQAFGQCLSTGVAGVAATVTPEAGAHQVVTGCEGQRGALETQFEAWVSGPNFPEAGREAARAKFKEQIGAVEPAIANEIRTNRAAPAPAPSPTPKP